MLLEFPIKGFPLQNQKPITFSSTDNFAIFFAFANCQQINIKDVCFFFVFFILIFSTSLSFYCIQCKKYMIEKYKRLRIPKTTLNLNSLDLFIFSEDSLENVFISAFASIIDSKSSIFCSGVYDPYLLEIC